MQTQSIHPSVKGGRHSACRSAGDLNIEVLTARKDGWMDGWTDGWMDGLMDGRCQLHVGGKCLDQISVLSFPLCLLLLIVMQPGGWVWSCLGWFLGSWMFIMILWTNSSSMLDLVSRLPKFFTKPLLISSCLAECRQLITSSASRLACLSSVAHLMFDASSVMLTSRLSERGPG